MNFFNNIRISNIGWAFVIALLISGGLFAVSSLITINNVTTIKETWDKFEESRSDQAAALSALRKEIGYGGMIHQFKNFVLRHDAERISIVNAKLGGAASAIARYRALDLNEAERGAIGDIQKMLNAYTKALSLASELVVQGKSQTEIDAQVRVDDTAAIQGLDTLDVEVTKHSGLSATRPNKSQAVASMRKAMGYGGMIHNFKNMVLRPDPKTRDRSYQDIFAAIGAIKLYSERSLNDAEQQALRNITGVVNAYKTALDTVDKLAEQGKSPAAIDRVVKIDDAPALIGFDTLTREISLQHDAEATEVSAALALVVSATKIAYLLMLVIMSLLVLSALWLIRTQITGPIARMTDIMTRLAAGNLDLDVPAKDQTNEIGQMARAVEIFRNTALDRKKGEQALRDREQRMSAILNNVDAGIVTIDQKGTIETFNPAAESIFGYASYEVIGKNVKCLMPEPYHGEHDGYLQSYHDTGKAKIIGIGREVFGQRKDGSTFPMELAVSNMNVSSVQMFTGIIRDITDRKQADMAKTEFVSTVSHELRTPLTSIKGSLGLIRSGALGVLPEKLHSMLDIAYNNSERLVLLINDILDMEKIQAGKMDFNMKPLGVASLIKDAMVANKGYGDEHSVTFECECFEDSIMVQGDGNRLMQVLSNLMSNAAKFSPQGGQVELSVVRNDSTIHITVRDYGPGIPEEFRKSIFEKFSQADSSDTRQKGGTGLGLSITKAIVEQHGGTIGFDSVSGEGSTFYFNLPEFVEQSEALLPEAHQEGLYRILICEDDAEIATILGHILDLAGYQTRKALNAAQARQLLAEGHFDAMTLDLGLPDQSGISLLQELRNDPKTQNLPVIVVSATAMEGKQELNGDAVGIIDWIEKPFDTQFLINRLGDALRHSSGARPRILHVEDDENIVEIIATLIEGAADVFAATTLSKARRLLKQQTFDLVILDLMLPDGEGETLLPLLNKPGQQSTPVIIFSAKEVSREISENIRAVLLKSQTTNEDLLNTIRSTIEARRKRD